MRRFASILILLILTGASAAQAARPAKRMGLMQATGFPNYCGDSLDCIVWRTGELIRGTVVGVAGNEITLRVRETVKGASAPGSTLTISAGGWGFATGQDVLISLHGELSGEKSPARLLLQRVMILDGKRPYYTMDLRPFTHPEQIMAAVRDLAAHPIDPNLKTVSLFSGGRILVVPANPELEVLGQQWAGEKTMYKRLLALQALEPFKSERNIALATALLDDTRSDEVQRFGKWQSGEYTVRHAAGTLLEHWNAPVPTLAMEGPIFNYRKVNPPRMGYVIAGGMLLLVLSAWSYRCRSAMVPRVVCSMIMIALIAALAGLWSRSGSRVDEIMFAAGNSHHEIASYRGGIQYQVLHDWDDSRELVYGNFDRELSDDVWSIDSQSPAKRRSVIGFCFASGTSLGPGGSTHRFGLFRIPLWVPVVLLTIPLALNGLALARQLRRRRLGLCRHCGYDLRETPSGVCPECGKEVPPKRRPASAPLEAGDEMPIGGQPVGM